MAPDIARLIALLVCLACSSTAAAQESYRLTWVSDEGARDCPDEAVVASDVSLRLGRNPFSIAAEKELEITLSRTESVWSAALVVRREDGSVAWSQPLQSQEPTCDTLANAVVLAVALMINPAAAVAANVSAAPAVTAAPDAEEEAAEEESAAPVPVVQPPAAPPTAPALEVHAGAVLSGGVLPRIAAAVSIGAGGELAAPLRWAVGMRFYPEVRTERPDDSFAFGLTAVSLSLCVDLRPVERLSVGGCISPQVGVIHAVVFEPDPTVPGDRPWVGVGTSAFAALRLVGPLWARADLGALWSALRQRFTVRDRVAPAFEQDLAGLDAMLSLSLRFP